MTPTWSSGVAWDGIPPRESSKKESKHVEAIENNMRTRGDLIYACQFRIVRNCCGTEGIGAKASDKLTMGEDEVKQLLTLMDADKNGKFSKEKYMRFMEAEFDKGKKGELDVKELSKSTTTASRFVGK